eukprot:TRINITY_DN12180_c0_g1_i1.p1 TRINITY_DN12180_c0_g1~~TRINITY_DN12180_c0_g1_i1.p1  ORF type:complete len:114 (+),score=23.58 TRINITY_DN12180_c0_g1_i1:122-463(+)
MNPSKLKLMVDRLAPSRGECTVVKRSGRELNANLLCVEGIHNKYYIMQVLKKGGKYLFYRRWGRCGTDGQKMMKECGSVGEAVGEFDKLLEKKMEEYSAVEVDYNDHCFCYHH